MATTSATALLPTGIRLAIGAAKAGNYRAIDDLLGMETGFTVEEAMELFDAIPAGRKDKDGKQYRSCIANQARMGGRIDILDAMYSAGWRPNAADLVAYIMVVVAEASEVTEEHTDEDLTTQRQCAAWYLSKELLVPSGIPELFRPVVV